MGIMELKKIIRLKEKELDELKAQLKEMECQNKDYDITIVKHHSTIENGFVISDYCSTKKHICGTNHYGRLVHNCKHLVSRWKSPNVKLWYEVINNRTGKLIEVIE